MARALKRLVISAIVGVLVTIAVAWGCAYWIGDPIQAGAVPVIGESRDGEMYWWIQREQVPGRMRFRSYFAPNAVDPVATAIPAEDVAPPWFDPHDVLRRYPPRADAWADVYAAGWPRLCLYVQLVRSNTQAGQRANWVGDGYRGGWRVTSNMLLHEALPIAPAWKEFGINTGFYGSIVFFLLTLLHVLGRANRLRRGLCPDCRYNLRKNFAAGCPECGWNRKEPARA